MPGVYVATILALLSMAFTCVGLGVQVTYPDASRPDIGRVLFVAALLLFLATIVVLARARGRGPDWVRRYLDDILGREAQPPQPDMPLTQVVRQAYPAAIDNPMMHTFRESAHGHIEAVLTGIRERARWGQFSVWGRLEASGGNPLAPIGAEYWEDHNLPLAEFIIGTGKTAMAKAGASNVVYGDIHLDRGQVGRVWPDARARWHFQWPVYRG
jgi:hypothetical protein